MQFFLKKTLKTVYFRPVKGGEGKGPLLPSPANGHDGQNIFVSITQNKFIHKNTELKRIKFRIKKSYLQVYH
jgi:hypothetical protein